jgi:hypothetical protein
MSDFRVTNHGSIVTLEPLTPGAKAWIEENLPEDRMTWCGATVVEPPYIGPIVDGMIEAGLTHA